MDYRAILDREMDQLEAASSVIGVTVRHTHDEGKVQAYTIDASTF